MSGVWVAPMVEVERDEPAGEPVVEHRDWAVEAEARYCGELGWA